MLNKTRLIIAAGLSLLVLTVCTHAQSNTPVNTAYELYTGCINGYLQSADVERDAGSVKEYIRLVDNNCLMWMMIWYHPVLGKDVPNMAQWPRRDMMLFEGRRKLFLMKLELELKD